MLKKIIFWLCIAVSSLSYGGQDHQDINKYVDNLVTQVSALLSDPALSQSQKIDKSSQLIKQNIDSNWMARYTLGNYRKTLTPAQIEEFIQIYANYIAKVYSDKVKDYKGQKALVTKVQEIDKDVYIVKTEVMSTSGAASIKVDYMVRAQGDGSLKIGDVITEGVSMISSQQSEFVSIISNKGFEVLVIDLKNKS